jgi:hypothetical protein
MQSRNLWNESVPSPRKHIRTISKHTIMRFCCLISCLPVAIKICLAYCYNLKANTNRIWQVFWSIYDSQSWSVQNTQSLQSKCKVRKCKHVIWYFAYSPLGDQISAWPAPARVFPQQEGRAWERGCGSVRAVVNLVPRACDPWEGNEGSGIIHVRSEYDWLLVYNGMLQFCKN